MSLVTQRCVQQAVLLFNLSKKLLAHNRYCLSLALSDGHGCHMHSTKSRWQGLDFLGAVGLCLSALLRAFCMNLPMQPHIG